MNSLMYQCINGLNNLIGWIKWMDEFCTGIGWIE